jgi:UDP-glucose 4-epimerase
MEGCDTVIHLAALTSVENSYGRPRKYYETNIVGTLHVIEAATQLGVKKFIFTSSAAVYAESLSPYGASKLVGERMLETIFPGNWAALRLFNVYGEGSKSVVDKFKHALLAGLPVDIYGDGLQTRDFIHVSQVCEVIAGLCSVSLPNSSFDVGSGQSTTILSLSGGHSVVHHPARCELHDSRADVTMLNRLLPFTNNRDIPLRGLSSARIYPVIR